MVELDFSKPYSKKVNFKRGMKAFFAWFGTGCALILMRYALDYFTNKTTPSETAVTSKMTDILAFVGLNLVYLVGIIIVIASLLYLFAIKRASFKIDEKGIHTSVHSMLGNKFIHIPWDNINSFKLGNDAIKSYGHKITTYYIYADLKKHPRDLGYFVREKFDFPKESFPIIGENAASITELSDIAKIIDEYFNYYKSL